MSKKIIIDETIYDKLQELIDVEGNIGDDYYQGNDTEIRTDKFDREGNSEPTTTDDHVDATSQKFNYFNGGMGTFYMPEEKTFEEVVYDKKRNNRDIIKDRSAVENLDKLSSEYMLPEIEADTKTLASKLVNIDDANKNDVFAIVLKYLIEKMGDQMSKNDVKQIIKRI